MRERLLADWPLKLVALLLAFGVWLSITGQDRMLSDFTVPLEVEYGPERIAGGPQPTAVTVRLEGPRTAMRKLDPLRMALRLDLRDAPYGEREVPLSRAQLTGVPRSVDISRFDPERVTLQVARRVRRELEIVPDFVGELPAGFALYGFEARPATISVEGTAAAVDGLGPLQTESIPLDGQTSSFVTGVGVIPEDSRVHVLGAERLEIEVLIDRQPVQARFEEIEVRVPGIPANRLSVHPPRVRATLSGPPRLIELLQKTKISATAVVGPGAANVIARALVKIELKLGDDERRLVSVRAIRPSHVTVRISE